MEITSYLWLRIYNPILFVYKFRNNYWNWIDGQRNMLSFSNIQLLIQSSMMWITNVALEIGKLFNKQNNRKKKTKNLLLFASTIPFMTHDPILFHSFFHSQNFSLLKTFSKKCLPIYDSSKNLMLLMFFRWKIETFHSIYMRVVYILVFFIFA